MAKVKSPNYPRLGLGEALAATRTAFEKDNRNKMSQAALAKHLGHDSLSGPAYTKIGTLRAYGLIEGRGDELRVSDDAVTALMAPEGSPERAVAVGALAAKPGIYQEIRADFPTPPSVENLKFWLIKRKFAQDAAETAAKAYLSTLRFVAGGGAEYSSGSDSEPERASMTPQTHAATKPVGSEMSLPPPAASPLRVTMNGDRLDIQASVDLEGLKKLRTMLEKYQGILEMMQPNSTSKKSEKTKYKGHMKEAAN